VLVGLAGSGRFRRLRVPRGTSEYLGVPRSTSGYLGVPRSTSGYLGVPRGTSGYLGVIWEGVVCVSELLRRDDESWIASRVSTRGTRGTRGTPEVLPRYPEVPEVPTHGPDSSARGACNNCTILSEFDLQPAVPRILEPFLRATLHGRVDAWPGDVNEKSIDEFLVALEWHGLASYFHEIASSRVPDTVRLPLRRRSLLQVAIEHARHMELQSVSAALHLRGVRTLAIKGSALAYQVYPGAHLRPRADHDLLIDSSSIDGVRESFLARGYTEYSTGGSLITSQTTFQRGEDMLSHVFDVHWRASNVHAVSRALDSETLFASATPHPVVEHLLVPSLPHSLLIALLHRAAHHHNSDRLIWLTDIDLLARSIGTAGVAALLEDARQREALSVCVRGLALTAEWFGTPLPPLPAAGRDRLRWLIGKRVHRMEFFVQDLRAIPTWKSRVSWLRELAFPAESFMRTQFSERTGESLYRLYLRRGLRSLGRIFKR